MTSTDVNFFTTEDNINNLEKVIDLIKLKTEAKSKFRDAYTIDLMADKHKLTTLGKRSYSLINDCFRSHHFDEAAKLLWVACQEKNCFDFSIYKATMVVLENICNENEHELMMRFCRDIQDQQLVNKLEVQLEYILYALRNNDENIGESFKKITAKRMKGKLKKIPCLEQNLNASCALLDYIIWHKSSGDDQMASHIKDIADKTISSMKNIIEQPGTWDIFVLKLVEMLEYYENFVEIEEILKKYIELNPEHINAYIYLCDHLHKYCQDDTAFIHYAKELSKLCPSDSRVLLLVHKWNEQGKKLKDRLNLLFKYLDYPVNGKDKSGWQMLALNLSQAISSEKSSSMKKMHSLWHFRRQAWSHMYFNPSLIENDPELIAIKIKAISFLQPDHQYIQEASETLSNLQKSKTFNCKTKQNLKYQTKAYPVCKLDYDNTDNVG